MTKKQDKEIETESRLTKVETVLFEIRDNHLVHLAADIKDLQSSVGNINNKLAYWSGSIIAVTYLLDKFIK
jgi:hypothetical protein